MHPEGTLLAPAPPSTVWFALVGQSGWHSRPTIAKCRRADAVMVWAPREKASESVFFRQLCVCTSDCVAGVRVRCAGGGGCAPLSVYG